MTASTRSFDMLHQTIYLIRSGFHSDLQNHKKGSDLGNLVVRHTDDQSYKISLY